jgi:hypothetical protein
MFVLLFYPVFLKYHLCVFCFVTVSVTVLQYLAAEIIVAELKKGKALTQIFFK